MKAMLGESEEDKIAELKTLEGKKGKEKRKIFEDKLSETKEIAMKEIQENWHLNLPIIVKETSLSQRLPNPGEWHIRVKAFS